MKTTILTIAFWMTFLSAVFAADPEKGNDRETYAQIDLTYLIGAQAYNDNFLYNPGYSILGTYGTQLKKRVYLGAGAGIQAFKDATFLPVFIDFTGDRSKKDKSGLLNMQLGYALAWSETLSSFDHCDMHGGMYLSAGLGRKFKISEQFSLAVMFSYRHQFASVEYQVHDAYRYAEQVNYDLLSIGIKIIL